MTYAAIGRPPARLGASQPMFNCVDRVDIKNGGAGGAGAVPRHAINEELYETTDLGKRVFEANPVLTAISNAVELA